MRDADAPSPAIYVGRHKALLEEYVSAPTSYRRSTLSTPPRVALLFIILDEFPLEAVWRAWAGDRSDVVFIFHAKTPKKVTSEWVRARLVNHARKSPAPPQWGSLELAQVMCYLLRVALGARPSATHFAFASESCVPIVSCHNFVDEIADAHNKSWIFSLPRATNPKEAQFAPLEPEIPAGCAVKSHQWAMLARKHARQIVNFSYDSGLDRESLRVADDRLWDVFRNVRPADEMIVGTVLCMAQGGELAPDEVEQRELTYTEWTPGAPHPFSYTRLSPALLRTARTKGCVFLRKVKPVNAQGVARIISDLGLAPPTTSRTKT
jgi:hypothetical protein